MAGVLEACVRALPAAQIGSLKERGRLDVPEYFDASFKVCMQGRVVLEAVCRIFPKIIDIGCIA